jgi:hypothetical protein
MPRRALRLAEASLSILIGCLPAHGQVAPQASPTRSETTVDDKENKAILEVGAATSWNVSGGAATFAPNLAVEIEPIENWLELEVGVSPFYSHSSKEWDTDLLFKEAMDPVAEGRIYVRHRPAMGSWNRRTTTASQVAIKSHSA